MGLRKRRGSSTEEKSDRGSVLPLCHLSTRRQLSQTHSEPDVDFLGLGSSVPRAVTVERSVTWAEPRITVIPPTASTARSMLLAMHSEYTRYLKFILFCVIKFFFICHSVAVLLMSLKLFAGCYHLQELPVFSLRRLKKIPFIPRGHVTRVKCPIPKWQFT